MKTFGTVTLMEDPFSGKVNWMLEVEPHVAIRLKRIFPRAAQTGKGMISVLDTQEVCLELEWVMERWPLEMSEADRTHLKVEAEKQANLEQTISDIQLGGNVYGDWRESARPPKYPHQEMNQNLISTTKRLLVTDSLGSGKTWTGASTFRNPESLPAVVVVPTHLPEQWVEEINASWPDLHCHIVKGTKVYDPRTTRQSKGITPDVFVVPYSRLDGWRDYLAPIAKTVIFDEVHELRNGTNTNKGSAAMHVSKDANYVVGLSGTPVFNYGGDIWEILNILKPDALGTRPEFLREWCGDRADSPGTKPIVSDPAALGTYLRDTGVMVGTVLETVEPILIPHFVESDPKIFDKMTSDAGEMARFLLSGSGTSIERFHMSGQFDMLMRQATGIAKAPYVAKFVELLLESKEKVLLFGWHRAVYDIWMRELSQFKPVMYTGSETGSQKLEAKRKFVEGDSRILIMSLRSGAGLDGLEQVCNTAVFGELDWSPSQHKQAYGRVDRPAQPITPVLAYFLHSVDGADPFMLETLGVKQRQSEPIVNPDVPTMVAATDKSHKIRELAAEVLRKKGLA